MCVWKVLFSPRSWYSHCFIWEGCWNKGMEACFENLLLCTAADTRAQQYHGRCFGRSCICWIWICFKILWGCMADGSHIFPFFTSSLPVKIICVNMFAWKSQEPAPASMHGNARCLSFPLVGSGLQSIVTCFGCHTMDDLLEATTRPSKASQWLQIRLATATGHEQKVMMLPTKNWEGSHWVLSEYLGRSWSAFMIHGRIVRCFDL